MGSSDQPLHMVQGQRYGEHFSSVLDTTQDTDNTKMLPYSVVLTVLAASVANCHPGGYTGLGGLYKNMNQNADYMQAAKHAAKMAVNIFDDPELGDASVVRARKSVYVPTFFTNQPQPALPQAQLQQLKRPSRDAQTYDLPIYYNEYRPASQQIQY